jgi:hypothetical protein
MEPEIATKAPQRKPWTLHLPTRTIYGWAALGLLFVGFELALFVAWFASGDARPTVPGPDKGSDFMRASLLVLQLTSVAAAVAFIAVVVVLPLRRDHRLSENGLWVLAFTTLVWQEPLLNYVHPQIAYNAALVNLGSWAAWIPGWRSPHPERIPVPLLVNGVAYIFVIFGAVLLAEMVIRAARRRWPNLRRGGLLAIVFAFFLPFLFLLEGVLFARTGAYVFAGVVPSLTLWSGHEYQYPLYQLVLGSIWFTGFTALRLFSNAEGWTVVERGAENLDVGTKARTAYRFLARVAACNLVFLVAYTVPMIIIGAHVAPWPPFIVNHSYFAYFTSYYTGAG